MGAWFKELLPDHLVQAETGWNMGGFGALAEFHQDRGETAVTGGPGAFLRVTKRGGIRFASSALPEITPVAYEALSPRPHRWTHGIALCLPTQLARMNRRFVLTELGPDGGAFNDADRDAILFDMGLGVWQADFCIRTCAPGLLAILREQSGRPLSEPGNPAMGAILEVHPHRVALTRIGRVEVYQKIGGPDTGGVSPPGPHTHVLPKLLRARRTHAANLPIPDGLVPCGYMHPANPVIGPMGEDRPFDKKAHEAFQVLLSAFGDRRVLEAKRQVREAVCAGTDPANFKEKESRVERAGMRIALRQMMRAAESRCDAALLKRIRHWQGCFDRAADTGAVDDGISEHS
ncbi:MAG: hypothetical protein MI753_18385 [Hyphomicrobiales bacterium]|nr:hypothetical protein [Hyphomicrobiales bacterium]